MKTLKSELPFIGIAMIPFVYLFYIWKKLPVSVPMHWGINGEVDRWGDKTELLLPISILTGITYFAFLVIPKIDPKQRLQEMGNKLNKFRLILAVFMSALATYILYAVQHEKEHPSLILPLVGLLFVFMGNYMKTIKPNYFIGIRTPWTLENEVVWKKTHHLAGNLWFMGGVLLTLTFLLKGEQQFYTFMVITAIITLIPMGYSYVEFKKIKG